MTKLNEVAQEIAQLVAGPNAAFDPAIILVIAELLIPLIEALQECFASTNEAVQAVNNPTLVQRLAVRMKVIGQMGRLEFRRNRGSEIVQAILDRGSDLSVNELEELYQEI